jgi:hypothetical protein
VTDQPLSADRGSGRVNFHDLAEEILGLWNNADMRVRMSRENGHRVQAHSIAVVAGEAQRYWAKLAASRSTSEVL